MCKYVYVGVDGCFRRSQAHVHIHVYTRTHTNYAGTEGGGANGDVVLEEAEVSIAAQDEAEPEEEVGEWLYSLLLLV